MFREYLECHMAHCNSWPMKKWKMLITSTESYQSILNWWVNKTAFRNISHSSHFYWRQARLQLLSSLVKYCDQKSINTQNKFVFFLHFSRRQLNIYHLLLYRSWLLLRPRTLIRLSERGFRMQITATRAHGYVKKIL